MIWQAVIWTIGRAARLVSLPLEWVWTRFSGTSVTAVMRIIVEYGLGFFNLWLKLFYRSVTVAFLNVALLYIGLLTAWAVLRFVRTIRDWL